MASQTETIYEDADPKASITRIVINTLYLDGTGIGGVRVELADGTILSFATNYLQCAKEHGGLWAWGSSNHWKTAAAVQESLR